MSHRNLRVVDAGEATTASSGCPMKTFSPARLRKHRSLSATFRALLFLAATCLPGGRAGCTSTGLSTGGSDDDAECGALVAMYTAWGGKPTSWGQAISSGRSYCSGAWSGVSCAGGTRIVRLCAPPVLRASERSKSADAVIQIVCFLLGPDCIACGLIRCLRSTPMDGWCGSLCLRRALLARAPFESRSQ